MVSKLQVRKLMLQDKNWRVYGEFVGSLIVKVRVEKRTYSDTVESVHFLLPGDEVTEIDETLPNAIAAEVARLCDQMREDARGDDA